MNKKRTIGEVFSRFGAAGIGVLTFLMMAGLTFCAFLFTSDMNRNNSVSENITFLNDKLWLNLLVLALCVALFWWLRPHLGKIPVKTLKYWLVIWTLAIGLLWVFSTLSYPTHDSRMVTQAGEAAARGDYNPLNDIYFKHFPFQLGYVFYSELMMRILPVKDFYLHIEAANILFLTGGYLAILHFMETVFHNERVTRLAILLLALCLQPVLFSTFLYGTIPGLFFALWAVAQTASYLKNGGWKHALLASVFLGLAVLMKQNYLIVLAAVCIILVLAMIQKPKWLHIGFLAMAVVIVLGLRSAVTLQYEKRADVEFGSGIPIISWAAMGLNEGYTTSGWYNAQYTVRNFDEHDGDAQAASAQSAKEIKTRLRKMKADPAYAKKFFRQKILSQWNEPSYQSIWTNQVRGHYSGGPWGPAKFVQGAGEGTVKGYMNFYQQFIFVCVLAALARLIRRRDLGMASFPLILLGGFLYHLIFEGKSQYIEPYFVMMVPLAAYGLHLILTLFDRVFDRQYNQTTIRFFRKPSQRPVVTRFCHTTVCPQPGVSVWQTGFIEKIFNRR